MSDTGPDRITVSRDALRADLGALELSMYKHMDSAVKRLEDSLGHKADAIDLVNLSKKVDALDRGDFTPVHRRALTEFIEERLLEQTDTTWTRRERFMAVVSAMVLMLAFLTSTVLSLSGLGR